MRKPSEHMQKHKAVFDLQIANLLVDKYVIDHTNDKILKQQSSISKYEELELSLVDGECTHYAAKFDVYMKHNPNTKKTDLNYEWHTTSLRGKEVDKKLLHTIVNLFFHPLSFEQQLQGIKIWGFTEYTRQGITFRCHPNYKNEGPWFDYALIAWEQTVNSKDERSKIQFNVDWNKELLDHPVETENASISNQVVFIPAKILWFVEDQNGKMFAIIHSCLDNSAKMSVLTYRWQLEFLQDMPVSANFKPYECCIDASTLSPVYHSVSVETIQKTLPHNTI